MLAMTNKVLDQLLLGRQATTQAGLIPQHLPATRDPVWCMQLAVGAAQQHIALN